MVKADLAGVDPADVALEIRGRQLVIAGERRPTQEAGGRLYQQIEIEHGPFRRIVELGADVVADEATASYDDGILQVEIPLAEPEQSVRRVPIAESMTIHVPTVNGDPADAAVAVAVSEAELPEALPVLPLRDSVAFPTRCSRSPSARSARSSWSTTCSPATACW